MQNVGVGSQSPERLLQKVEGLEREIALTRSFAYHDALTGLPNRALMLDRLEQSIAEAARQQQHVGLLFLGLDDFKQIHENLGPQVGNAILQQVAARLLSCLRAGDTACRYTEDEFVVLLPQIQSAGDMEGVKQKIAQRLSAPHRLDARSVVLDVSIGGALLGRDAESGADLVRVADADRHQAKRLARKRSAAPEPARNGK